jgi:hypothetical protein
MRGLHNLLFVVCCFICTSCVHVFALLYSVVLMLHSRPAFLRVFMTVSCTAASSCKIDLSLGHPVGVTIKGTNTYVK